ncbi:MAG: dihydropteridine reductase [Clostridia bacterium]|nr:dihydropteridine reductase [Clostridia bacterium]
MANENDRKVVEKIRNNYIDKSKEHSKLEELKALDKKVKVPAMVFAYIFGTIGTLVLGVGMCLAMKIIGDAMVAGVIIGLIGIVMVVANYPLYHKILNKRKAKFSNEIIAKSDELLNK